MPSYARSKDFYEANPFARLNGKNRAYVNGKAQDTDWDERWLSPAMQEQAKKGQLPDDVTVFGGEIAPTSSDPSRYRWLNTGTIRRPEMDPLTSHDGDRGYDKLRSSVQPRWEKVFIGSSGSQAASPAAEAPKAPDEPSLDQLDMRREAFERAQQRQTEAASVPRPQPPSDPMSSSFYGDLNSYGRYVVNNYLSGRDTEQKRVQLGLEENNVAAKRSLLQIDPKKMNISKPTTFDQMVEQMKTLRGLIS